MVTATRGERGEVVDGPLQPLAGTDALVMLRERELAGAIAALGVGTHAFLGSAPARAAGLPPRRYRDSGMRWVTPTVAGPSDDAGTDALTAADREEAAYDLVAFLDWFGPDLLVSYDVAGGYGHPDHVACHHIAARAARSAQVRLVEVVSGLPMGSADGVEVLDLGAYLPAATAALGCHASQLTVVGEDVVHSGGQRQPIVTRVGLRVG